MLCDADCEKSVVDSRVYISQVELPQYYFKTILATQIGTPIFQSQMAGNVIEQVISLFMLQRKRSVESTGICL